MDEEYVPIHVDGQPGPHVLLQVSDPGVGMTAGGTRRSVRALLHHGTGQRYGARAGHGVRRGPTERRPNRGLFGGRVGNDFQNLYACTAAAALARPQPRVRVEPPARAAAILFVEDDERVRTFATSVLARVGQHHPCLRQRGGRACGPFRAKPEAELLTDVIMSGMDGRVLAEHVAERLPNIRVLFVSAAGQRHCPSRHFAEGHRVSRQALLNRAARSPGPRSARRALVDLSTPYAKSSRGDVVSTAEAEARA